MLHEGGGGGGGGGSSRRMAPGRTAPRQSGAGGYTRRHFETRGAAPSAWRCPRAHCAAIHWVRPRRCCCPRGAPSRPLPPGCSRGTAYSRTVDLLFFSFFETIRTHTFVRGRGQAAKCRTRPSSRRPRGACTSSTPRPRVSRCASLCYSGGASAAWRRVAVPPRCAAVVPLTSWGARQEYLVAMDQR